MPHGGGDLHLGAPHRLANFPKRVIADEFLAARLTGVLDGLGLPRDPLGGVNGAIGYVCVSRC